MNEVGTSLRLFAPELLMVLAIVVLFLLDAFVPLTRSNRTPLYLILGTCLLGVLVTYANGFLPSALFFSGSVAHDPFSGFFRYLFLFSCGLSAYIAYGAKELDVKNRLEFSILLLSVTFGLSLMALATNLLVLYIGIETVSIISFVMAGYNREDVKSNEASLKYFIFGALSSGLMLYGMSLLYGYSGSLQYQEIGKAITEVASVPLVLSLALVMIYAGFAYKISAFPMHFWTPDVYEGAPTPVATFFSVGPKAAGFAAMIRFLIDCLTQPGADGSFQALGQLRIVDGVAVLAALTMCAGNLSALAQTNVKRMLAFSSIAHVGYMLMGLISLDTIGLQAILFYLIAYCIMNLGAFWVASIVSDLKGSAELDSFRGVGRELPVLGICMAIFLFSLTGIPMFSGFVGKFLLFATVIKMSGYLWLALLGVINSVVSLYYYAKILKAIWMEEPARVQTRPLSAYHGIGLMGLAIPTIVLGLFFGPVIGFALAALKTLL